MNISDKLVVPQLQAACLNFLLTHAAGKPIKALRIAELFDIDELYKEASRFVLENPGGWSESELSTLSKETLLKLEKRSVVTNIGLRNADIAIQEKLVPRTSAKDWPGLDREGVPMCAFPPFRGIDPPFIALQCPTCPRPTRLRSPLRRNGDMATNRCSGSALPSRVWSLGTCVPLRELDRHWH
jgi:hypothetical protein